MPDQFAAHTHNRDAIIMAWNESKKKLEEAKTEEARLRKEVTAMCFYGAKEGTNKLELGQGYALKAVVKKNYSVKKNEEGNYNHVRDAVTRLSALNASVASEIVKWSCELSVSTYKKLTEEERAIVNEFVTITDGMPSLEMVEPKAG